MASHANFLPPSIDDYFRIVDPKGKLSQPERIRKMNDVLDNLQYPFVPFAMVMISGMKKHRSPNHANRILKKPSTR